MVIDPISDMLITVKNAARVKKGSVLIPYSKIKWEIARIMKDAGYFSNIDRKGKKVHKIIEADIAYRDDGTPCLSDVKRISKPSRRVYKGSKEIGKVKQGFGLMIISTSKGLKTDKEARGEKMGGEIICEIW